jgi:hypothetical protein
LIVEAVNQIVDARGESRDPAVLDHRHHSCVRELEQRFQYRGSQDSQSVRKLRSQVSPTGLEFAGHDRLPDQFKCTFRQVAKMSKFLHRPIVSLGAQWGGQTPGWNHDCS